MASFTLLDDEKVGVSLVAVDDQNNPAALPAGATVTWASSEAGVVAVAQDAANPLAAELVTTGKLGTAQVTVTVAQANAPAGASPLTGTLDISVVASAAVGISIQPGTASKR